MIHTDLYIQNRQRLMKELGDELVILTAHHEMQRAGDMSYPFQQETNFLWLTGIRAANWQLVLRKGEACLVMPDVNEVRAIFDGALSAEEAKKISGVDRVITSHEYDAYLAELKAAYDKVYTLGKDPSAQWYTFSINPAVDELRASLEEHFNEVADCRRALMTLRAIKQPAEIEAIKQAIAVTADAFTLVKSKLADVSFEYEIEAVLNSEFRRTGAGGHAYDPIVAAEKNACTLHYVQNNNSLPRNGLVLIDAGANVVGYSADITRTYAIGKPSGRQAAVHAAVEAAHHKIISLIRPGVKLQDYVKSVEEIMKDTLQELGLLAQRDDVDMLHKYFPHAISHGLGIDVHESLGGYGEFKPGMIFTVEPGIYIPEEGIGVRIEDDILVTESGYENLSASLSTGL